MARSIKLSDLKKLDDVPASIRENGIKAGIPTALIIAAPFVMAGLVLPPPFGQVMLGAAAVFAIGVTSLAHMKSLKLKREWIEENRDLFKIDDEKTIEGKATVVPEKTRAEKIQDNLTKIATVMNHGYKAALENKTAPLDPELNKKIKRTFRRVHTVISDYVENNLNDSIIAKFAVVDSMQYVNTFESFKRVRERKIKVEASAINALDERFSTFLDNVEKHVIEMQEHALVEDDNKFNLDMNVATNIMDRALKDIAERVNNERGQVSTDQDG